MSKLILTLFLAIPWAGWIIHRTPGEKPRGQKVAYIAVWVVFLLSSMAYCASILFDIILRWTPIASR